MFLESTTFLLVAMSKAGGERLRLRWGKRSNGHDAREGLRAPQATKASYKQRSSPNFCPQCLSPRGKCHS